MNRVHYNHFNAMLKLGNVVVKHLSKDKIVISRLIEKETQIFFIMLIYRCRPGFFNLDAINPDGCTKCFCYGHASTCQSAPNYYYNPIRSSFSHGKTFVLFVFTKIFLNSTNYRRGWLACSESIRSRRTCLQ